MTFIAVKRVVIALTVVLVTTCCVLYLPKQGTLFSWTGSRAADSSSLICVDGGVMSTQEKKYSLPLPDARHPVVSMNSKRYLRLIERGPNSKVVARWKVAGVISSRDGAIVLRYRANTSTNVEPTSGAGRLAAVFLCRLGNWMGIYAGLYGIARRNGMRHVISANNQLLTLFRLNATVVPSERPVRHWVQYIADDEYDRHTGYLDPRTNVELVGYFCSLQYYGHVMRDLVQNEAVQQEADNFLRRSMAKFHLSPSDVAVIAVHIRRTDRVLLRIKAGRGASVANRKYFTNAVIYFNRLCSNKTMFVVCSDDMEWSKANFVTESPTVFSVGHTASVDFAILSRCNHSIITMGTYGKWSAYLAGGVTVYHDQSYGTVRQTQNPRLAWIGLS